MCFKKKATPQPTEQETLMLELIEAKENLKLATANFNNADSEYFEIANEELTMARQRVDTVAAKLKRAGYNGRHFDRFSRISY